jgi:ABC-type amino acid transport substrate-binding protein
MANRFLTLLIVLPFLVQGQVEQVHLASDIWPPFTNEESKSSFAQDIVREALKRNEIGVKTSILSFSGVMEGIKSGIYDGSAALWYTKKREEHLIFSKPYLQNQLVLVGRKGTDVGAYNFSVLAGKKVAIVGSYAYGAAVDTALNVRFVDGASDQDNLNKLLRGEVDYMLVDALLIEYLLKYQQEKVRKFLEIASRPLIIQQLYFALRKNIPQAEEIVNGFNDAIKQMVADGTYNEILHLTWIRADVDGDGTPELVLEGKEAGTKAPLGAYGLLADSNPISQNGNQRYYIEGKFYDSWNNVPESYKVPPPVSEKDLSTIGAIGLRF